MKIVCLYIMTVLLSCCQGANESDEKTVKNERAELDNAPESILGAKPTSVTKWAPSVDTAWAISLYKDAERFEPFSQIEEYQQFELYHESVISIITHTFGTSLKVKNNIQLIEKNSKRYMMAVRDSVTSDYNRFHSVDGMDFDFLLNKKDTVAKTLLIRMLTDKNVSEEEKKYSRRMLIKHYGIK